MLALSIAYHSIAFQLQRDILLMCFVRCWFQRSASPPMFRDVFCSSRRDVFRLAIQPKNAVGYVGGCCLLFIL
eukprot:m.151594 g.151594  ORF g.151594 m.151594 type:complete len:73 (+) comp14251_c0_seq7:2296-2514(+)